MVVVNALGSIQYMWKQGAVQEDGAPEGEERSYIRSEAQMNTEFWVRSECLGFPQIICRNSDPCGDGDKSCSIP